MDRGRDEGIGRRQIACELCQRRLVDYAWSVGVAAAAMVVADAGAFAEAIAVAEAGGFPGFASGRVLNRVLRSASLKRMLQRLLNLSQTFDKSHLGSHFSQEM